MATTKKIQSPGMRRAFARNLRAHLRRLEWSEAELARRSGVSQKHINNATNSRTTSSIEAVDALARALKVPAWMLLVEGFEDVDQPAAMQLAELVGVWLGAGDDARRAITATARRQS